MVKVVFIEHDGNSHEVNAYTGESLMEAAVSNNVPGIDADCGGNCACGTCQVFVNSEWISKVGEKSEMENSMLEFSEKNHFFTSDFMALPTPAGRSVVWKDRHWSRALLHDFLSGICDAVFVRSVYVRFQ